MDSRVDALHLQVLGDLALRRGETLVSLELTELESALLAYLLLHRDAPQRRQHLAFVLWPEAPESRTRARLRKTLFDLRRRFPPADDCIESTASTLWWLPEAPVAVDLIRLEDALSEADVAEARGDAAAQQAALQTAVELYRGDLMPDLYEDWVVTVREQLSQRFMRALIRLQALLAEAGAYKQAINIDERLLQTDPLYEPAYRDLMQLHLMVGNRAAAVRVYHTCVTELDRELGVLPSVATREVYERLLGANVSLGKDVTDAGLSTAWQPPGVPEGLPSLVGRDSEFGRLQSLWLASVGGSSQVAVIDGVAGIGKTRLAEELVHWARGQGARVAVARCYAAEGGLPFVPVVQWLRSRPLPDLAPVWRREVARLLPDIDAGGGDRAEAAMEAESDAPWQQQRLFEGLARAVFGWSKAQGRDRRPEGRNDGLTAMPLFLLLDDLQWADATTLAWLHYLLRNAGASSIARGESVFLLMTLRSEIALLDHPAQIWLRDLRRTMPVSDVHLQALTEADTLTLASRVLGQALDKEVAACLIAETEGNPLFVVEMVRSGLLGDLAAGQATEVACPPQGMPAKVQATIESRLALLSEEARAIAEVAATIGRAFTFPVLVAASEQSHDTVLRALDELWRRRVIRETGPVAYDFTHDKLRAVAIAGQSHLRARTLHGRVAAALETVYADELDEVAGRVAQHYEQAGDTDRSIAAYLRAAAAAQRVFANDEAQRIYEHVLTMVPEMATKTAPQRIQAMLGLGRVLWRRGDGAGAEEVLRPAIALAHAAGVAPGLIARLYHSLGMALFLEGKFAAQFEASSEALSRLSGQLDAAELALIQVATPLGFPEIRQDQATKRLWQQAGEYVAGQPYVTEFATIYQVVLAQHLWDKNVAEVIRWLHLWGEQLRNVQDVRGEGMLHQRWADLLGKQGHLVEAIRHLRLAIASLDQTEEAADGAFWYWRLALWSLQLGDLDSAVQYSGQNLSWAEASRGPYYLSWGQWLRGLILTCVGDLLGAEESLVRSLSNIKGDDDKVVVVAWLCHLLLGEIHMRVGNGSLALADFQRAAALSKPGVPAPTGGGVGRIWFTEIGSVLHGLEAAAPDKATFQDLCRSYPYRDTFVTESPPRRIPDYFALTQWYLEPADTAHEAGPQVRSEPPGFAFGDNQLGKAWSWHDPIGDCSFRTTTSEGDGVVLLAANNRGLAYINHSAPRLLHRLEAMETATGFVLAAIAVPAAEDRPATGGLLLWVDEDNFVRLDWGKLGPRDVALLACKRGQDMLIGRGRLPDASGEHVPGPAPRPTRVWLRFAVRRTGDSADIGLEPAQRVPLWHVTALCSVNGKQWWTAGSTTFALPPSAKGGVYATGRIDRVVHPGAWPHGTGIAFRSVQLRTIE